MRAPCCLLMSLWLVGCDDGGESSPPGEMILQVSGGYCDGPCPRRELWRDGDQLRYLHEQEQGRVELFDGAWTDEGLAEYETASREAFVDPDLSPRTCTESDLPDRVITLLDDAGDTWTVRYCGSGSWLPPSLRRADELFSRTIGALYEGVADPFVALE